MENVTLSWEEQLKVLNECIALMEKAVYEFHQKLGNPTWVGVEGKERFEYSKPDSLLFQYLKSVRIVSGLNAMGCLLEKGYSQEVGVLARTIIDFIDEIHFVQEAHEKGECSDKQKEIVDIFFSKNFKDAEDFIEKVDDGEPTVTKRHIHASLSRRLGGFENPDRVRKICKVEQEVYSGYVHGGYRQIMELCYGEHNLYGNIVTGFSLRGTLNTPLMEGVRCLFKGHINRSLNTLAIIAINLQMQELKEELLAKRRELQEKKIYDPSLKSVEIPHEQ